MQQSEIATTCSQANDSFVRMIQRHYFFVLKLIQSQKLSYVFQHNFFCCCFSPIFPSRILPPGLRLLEIKKISFLFPYIQLCFCNRTTGFTSLQYIAQLSTSALRYWPCYSKICECLLMLLTSEARILRWLRLF